jgi:hypothetical protein
LISKFLVGRKQSEVVENADESGFGEGQGEQAAASNEVSKSASLSAQNGERQGEQDNKDCEATNAQPLRASPWLKNILPEATNGWWDVRDKGNGATIKFRWRDPNLQVITLLNVTNEQFETLKQNGYEDAKSMIREKISYRLHSLSLDPARRDKAMIAARKLGIDLE